MATDERGDSWSTLAIVLAVGATLALVLGCGACLFLGFGWARVSTRTAVPPPLSVPAEDAEGFVEPPGDPEDPAPREDPAAAADDR